MEPHCKVDDRSETDNPYGELIGSLLYLSSTCRPDITYAVPFLSWFMHKATKTHWNMAIRILKYLKGTVDHGLLYRRSSKVLLGQSDSEFACDLTDRKSTSGFIFILNGAAISWQPKKQTIVAQSTAEAEYVAMSFDIRETFLLKSLLCDRKVYRHFYEDRVSMKTENMQVIDLSRDEIVSENSKHIDMKYQLVRDEVKKKTVDLSL